MSTAIVQNRISAASQPRDSFSNWFTLSAGVILGITGIAKVWSGLGNSKLLAVVDPIIGIKFGHLMLVVGVAEIVIALVCFFVLLQSKCPFCGFELRYFS